MVMGEGNPRVAGGWVLLPLIGEPVGVLVPCELECEGEISNLQILKRICRFFRSTHLKNSKSLVYTYANTRIPILIIWVYRPQKKRPPQLSAPSKMSVPLATGAPISSNEVKIDPKYEEEHAADFVRLPISHKFYFSNSF